MRGVGPWLAVTACTYSVLHHVGSALAPLGSVGPTRWADWLDLLTPYAVLLPAAAVLTTARARRWVWAAYAVGAVTYAEGHGIHLAANSVGNSAPGAAAHLWDEVVGHYLWYGGWTIILAALAAATAGREPPRGPMPYILAVLVGTTAGTNALEGGTVPLALVSGVGFLVVGWRTRHRLGRLLAVAAAATLLVVLAYGLWQGGFPQPSQLSWRVGVGPHSGWAGRAAP